MLDYAHTARCGGTYGTITTHRADSVSHVYDSSVVRSRNTKDRAQYSTSSGSHESYTHSTHHAEFCQCLPSKQYRYAIFASATSSILK